MIILKNYLKKIIAIDLRKQQALDASPKSNTTNYFTGNLGGDASAKMVFHY